MFKIIVGVALGIAMSALARPILAGGGLLVFGVVAQVWFARAFHRHYGGADPSAMGARSLSQLAAVQPVPASLRALEFLAKACLWGFVAALLVALGWLSIG